MKLDDVAGKKVLIVGFGQEGIDTFLFLKKRSPDQRFGVADAKNIEELSTEARRVLRRHPGTALHLGKKYLERAGEYDVVVRSPGVPLRTLKPFLTKRQRVTSQTDIFFDNCKGTIVGVTGTKGKSTTCALLLEVLKKAGRRVHLIGNIGASGLLLLDGTDERDIFIYELSSFQLMGLNKSPHIAVLLNVYPEHFDHHKDFAEYKRAKGAITARQSPKDILVYNKEDKEASAIARASKAKTVGFTPGSSRLLKKQERRWIAPIEPVIAVGELLGVSREDIRQALLDFHPLEHRIEPAGEYKGITFINDSAATNPGATMEALKHFGKGVATIILGGSDKGAVFGDLARAVAGSGISTVVLFPVTGEAIWKEIQTKAARPPQAFFVSSMKEAVRVCYERTPKGKICLLSPACASFSTFKDYKDRGEQFKNYAALYGKA